MAKYMFVGFPVEKDQSVNIPDDVVIVGANFTVGNAWQIMCLVPTPEQPEQQPEAETQPPEGEEETEHADVPPES